MKKRLVNFICMNFLKFVLNFWMDNNYFHPFVNKLDNIVNSTVGNFEIIKLFIYYSVSISLKNFIKKLPT